MMYARLDQVAISRMVGGEGFEIATPRFGPMFEPQLLLQAVTNRSRLTAFPHLSSEHDGTIVRAFESIRQGMSVDRFLCDPKLSKRLHKECERRGVNAPEAAINLRLFAIRKQSRNLLRNTTRPASTRDIVERLGLGVEAAMRYVQIRFGASVDDMIAHPAIGSAFVDYAKAISRGGTDVDYRLCALQVRKSRHVSGVYSEKVDELRASLVESRWMNIGSLKQMAWKKMPPGPGIVELRASKQSLFVLRTRHVADSVERSFSPKSVEKLLSTDLFSDIDIAQSNLRCLDKQDLPIGTPKAWELLLIQEFRPRFNWPVYADAA